MVNQKCVGIPAFQGKTSFQSMLATRDLGIMMEHENFDLKVTHINGDVLTGDMVTNFNDVGDHITY